MISAPASRPSRSLLQDLLAILVGDSRLTVSFEDLTGFTRDSPDVGLDLVERQHCSAFCAFAKAHQVAPRDCVHNKRACNRLAIARRAGFEGMCHLGMTEAVQPLIVKGKLLGVFYFGGCVLAHRRAEAEDRIRASCARSGRDPAPYLARLREQPCLDAGEWERWRGRFLQMVRVVERLVQSLDLPTSSYVPQIVTRLAMNRRALSALTLKALTYVQKMHADTCTLEACARHVSCHPVHLSRTFKKETGVDFHEHVHQVRIDHARHLLHIRGMNATRVSYEVGYADTSHFTRVFKRIVGQTPAAFARSAARV